MQTKHYKAYLLLVLLLCLMFNKVEHAALGVMLQNIKTDLELTDTQLGLLTGIAFTLFYATMGVPIGRWSDRGDRVRVISITTMLQCGALALSGMAANFVQLMVLRIGVAVGEAGAVAPANSLIADHFERADRPRATAWFMLGYPASAICGYFLGGWLNEMVGWRMTFVLLGLPGLAVALLTWLTLKDPRRSLDLAATSAAQQETPPLLDVLATLWRNRSYRHLVFGYSLLTFFGIGVIMWLPTFFIRSYGFTTTQLGLWLALIWGVGGVAGSIAAASFVSRRARGDEHLLITVLAIIFVGAGCVSAGIYLSPSAHLAFGLLAIMAAVNYGTAGPLYATIQSLVPERMRSVAVAISYLFSNLIGVGLGPLAVGVISDRLTLTLGDEALRYALLSLCPGYLWGAWHFWRARSTIVADVEAALPATQARSTAPLQESYP